MRLFGAQKKNRAAQTHLLGTGKYKGITITHGMYILFPVSVGYVQFALDFFSVGVLYYSAGAIWFSR